MTLVRSAMLLSPTLHTPAIDVGEARRALGAPKTHMLLLVEQGVLVGTLVESDLPADDDLPALPFAELTGRTIGPDVALEPVHEAMVEGGVRRLAVVEDGRLLGLLSLKAHHRGFCSDADVAERRQALR